MKKLSTLGSIYFQGVSGIFYEKERNRLRDNKEEKNFLKQERKSW